MLSRALSLATVTLLIGGFAAIAVRAQNLEAGKTPSQIFAGTCNACHKSPRGLLKTVAAGSLPGFLRQHYTTSSEMASLLSSFLVSNGAADTRLGGQPKAGKDAKTEPKPAKQETQPQQATRPDPDGPAPQGEPGRKGRKRLARPGEAPDGTKPAAEGQPPEQATIERGPDGRKLTARQKLGKRGKPGSQEPPKPDAVEPTVAEPKPETPKPETPKTDTVKEEGTKPEGAKPSGEAAKLEPPKTPSTGEPAVLRADPVPPVTPAPKSPEGDSRPVQTATPPAPQPAPATPGTASPATAEPAPPPPAVTASAPPPPPVAPAGPPAPPISQ
jgi:hypothetical protein